MKVLNLNKRDDDTLNRKDEIEQGYLVLEMLNLRLS